jgi:hypothetical protein
MDSRLEDNLDDLLNMDCDDMVAELLSARRELVGLRDRVSDDQRVLDMTRNNVDRLRRIVDLVHYLSDHISEGALGDVQLDAIAAVVWPAMPEVVDTAPTNTVDISKPTVPNADTVGSDVLMASSLLWNAHWFLRSIENLSGPGGSFVFGDDLARQVGQWRDRVNMWRHATGTEKVEDDETGALWNAR